MSNNVDYHLVCNDEVLILQSHFYFYVIRIKFHGFGILDLIQIIRVWCKLLKEHNLDEIFFLNKNSKKIVDFTEVKGCQIAISQGP